MAQVQDLQCPRAARAAPHLSSDTRDWDASVSLGRDALVQLESTIMAPMQNLQCSKAARAAPHLFSDTRDWFDIRMEVATMYKKNLVHNSKQKQRVVTAVASHQIADANVTVPTVSDW
ncbi:TPA: hypothetical protein ACH3X3_005526 [Trebouxia sp. C0006]